MKYNDFNTNRRQQWGIFPQRMEILQNFLFLKWENIIQMFQTLFKCFNWKKHMNKLKYNDINTNQGIFPDNNVVFFPPKMEICNFFHFSNWKTLYKCSKHYSSVSIEKLHMTKLKYKDINTNWGIFPDNNGVFFPPKMEICNFVHFSNWKTLYKCSKRYSNVSIDNSTKLKYNDIQIGGFFPTTMGYFFPKKWKFAIFSFLKLENIIQMFQTLVKCLNWKSIWLGWNIITITQIVGILPTFLGNFPNKEREIPQKKSKVAFSNNNGKR